MRDQKIAYSIEEASVLSGIGRNTIRRLVEWEGRDLLIKDVPSGKDF